LGDREGWKKQKNYAERGRAKKRTLQRLTGFLSIRGRGKRKSTPQASGENKSRMKNGWARGTRSRTGITLNGGKVKKE